MVGATLEHQGYSVQLAESGREATEFLKRGTFDLVLTDIVMQDGKDSRCWNGSGTTIRECRW